MKSLAQWSIGIIIVILTILWIKSLIKENKESKDNSPNTETVKNTEQASHNNEELMFSGKTPCNTYIDYKNTIKTGGKPVYIKYTGIKEKVYYSGSGDLYTPGVQSGPVYITSADENQVVDVQVYKIE